MSELTLNSIYGTPIYVLKQVQEDLSSVYGAVYKGRQQEWWFPAFWPVQSLVITDLQKRLGKLTLSEEARTYNSTLENYIFPEDFTFITLPYAHQREGLAHVHRYLRAGLFYSQGLGKCKIIIDLQRLTQCPMLIFCPKVMLHTWAEEFEKHGQITNVAVLDGTKLKKTKIIQAAITSTPVAIITTYDTAARYHEELIKINYTCIVADESHQIKTPFSQRTKAAIALASRAHRRILLSGTPSLGSPFDLYGQLRFLGAYFCPENWWAFRKKFGVFPAYENDEKVPKVLLGFKNIDIMNARVNLISKSKTKEECLDLPERLIIDKHFNLSPAQKKQYNNFVSTSSDAVGYGVRTRMLEDALSFNDGTHLDSYVLAQETITVLGKLDQLNSGFLYTTKVNPKLCNGCAHVTTCVANNISPYTSACQIIKQKPESAVFDSPENTRLEECQALIESIVEEPTNKVIIWTVYRRELDHVEFVVKGLNLEYVRVQGGLDSDKLTAARQRFNTDANCRVYLGQISTGIGVTLNAANYVIYYNLPWSLQHYLQSLDRNYRIGQERTVTAYRLIARHTLDEAKAAAMDQKIDFNKLVLSADVCATCPEFARRCAKFNIRLYDETCIYSRELERKIVKVRPIP